MKKQTISSMEAEMDMYIKKREELSKRIEEYNKRLDRAVNKNQVYRCNFSQQVVIMIKSMKKQINVIDNVSFCVIYTCNNSCNSPKQY